MFFSFYGDRILYLEFEIMNRQMSEVLRVIYTRLELCSSIYQALDDAQRYGDISRIERLTADKMVSKWLGAMDEPALMNATTKKIAFKKFIQTVAENERVII